MTRVIITLLVTISISIDSYGSDRLEDFYSAAPELEESVKAWQCYMNSKYQEYIFSTVFEPSRDLVKLRKYQADMTYRNDVKDELVAVLEKETINNRVHAKSTMLSNCFDRVGVSYSDRIYTCSYYDSALFNLNILKERGISKVTATSKILGDWKYLERVYFVRLVDRIYSSKQPIDKETFAFLGECLASS